MKRLLGEGNFFLSEKACLRISEGDDLQQKE